jgi:hypothetical protein
LSCLALRVHQTRFEALSRFDEYWLGWAALTRLCNITELPEIHAFVRSFVHYSSIPFISHYSLQYFSSRSAVGVVSTARDGYTWHRKTEKKQQRERERERTREVSQEELRCAALLKIQIGFSFCVQENAPTAVTPSEKEVKHEAKLRPNCNQQPFIGCLGPTTCWQSIADPPPRPLSAESLMEID